MQRGYVACGTPFLRQAECCYTHGSVLRTSSWSRGETLAKTPSTKSGGDRRCCATLCRVLTSVPNSEADKRAEHSALLINVQSLQSTSDEAREASRPSPKGDGRKHVASQTGRWACELRHWSIRCPISVSVQFERRAHINSPARLCSSLCALTLVNRLLNEHVRPGRNPTHSESCRTRI